MMSLALDPEVVASAWEQQVGCSSIFSPHFSDADFTVPSVIALDLSDIEAGMRQLPQQHLPQALGCSGNTAAATAAMVRPELLLQWDAVLPVSLLPAAGQTLTASVPSSTCTAAHKLHCVPDTPVSLSSSTSSNDKVCGPRPAVVLPAAKRTKQELQQLVSAELAEDAQCGVVPDAPAASGVAVPSSSCCSSDSSSGGAADGQDSAAASASGAQVPQMPGAAMYVNGDAGAVPAAVMFAMQHPLAQPVNQTPSSSAAGSAATAAAAKPSWLASSATQQHRKPHSHAAKAAAHHGNRVRTAHAAAAAATAAAAAEPFMRTRAEALARYHEKRANRTHAKKIRYHLRKVNADKRPRIKGRFVKKGELAEAEADDAAAAAAAADVAGYSVWDEAGAEAAGAVLICWEQQNDFLQAMQLPGMAVELAPAAGSDAAAAAAAPVPAQQAASAAAGGADAMQMFGSAGLPDSSASAGDDAAADAAEVAAAAAMDMHLLGHLELGFGGLADDAAEPMLGEDFFNDVHDMTESSGASHACLLLN